MPAKKKAKRKIVRRAINKRSTKKASNDKPVQASGTPAAARPLTPEEEIKSAQQQGFDEFWREESQRQGARLTDARDERDGLLSLVRVAYKHGAIKSAENTDAR